MSLKDFRDDWETWSKGKKIVSIIIGCCILTLVFSAIFGIFTPDMNTYEDSGDFNSDPDAFFEINEEDIPVKSSNIDITDQQTKSSSYAYFYESTGEYAEAAYTTYTAEDILVKMDLSKIKLTNNSVTEYSVFFGDPDVYNTTNLVDDLSTLIKSDDVSISLDCYDKKDNFERSYDQNDLKVSVKDGILTLKFSDSSTSDFHTKYDHDVHLDHARVKISGLLNSTDYSRPVDFYLVSEDMPITAHT